MPAPEIFISAGEVSGDLHAAALLAELRRLRPDLARLGRRRAAASPPPASSRSPASSSSRSSASPRSSRGSARSSRCCAGSRASSRGGGRRSSCSSTPRTSTCASPRRRARSACASSTSSRPQVWAWRRGRLRDIRAHGRPRAVHPALRGGVLPRGRRPRRSTSGTPSSTSCAPRRRRAGAARRLRARPGAPGRRAAPREPAQRGPGAAAVAARGGARCSRAARRGRSSSSPRPSAALRAAAARRWPPAPLAARVVDGRAWDCLAAADAAVVASGTATLETALIGTPFVTVYRVSPLSHAIARRLVRARWASLPNLLLGEPAVRELLQRDCRPETIAAEDRAPPRRPRRRAAAPGAMW